MCWFQGHSRFAQAITLFLKIRKYVFLEESRGCIIINLSYRIKYAYQSKQWCIILPTCRKHARTFMAKGLWRFPRYSPTFSLARPELLSWRNRATAGGDSSRKSFCITRSGLVNNSILFYAICNQGSVQISVFLQIHIQGVRQCCFQQVLASNMTVSLCLWSYGSNFMTQGWGHLKGAVSAH